MSKSKNSSIELLRFIAALLIMYHHTWILRGDEGFAFKDAWVYVEFYLILTGLFTTMHFDNISSNNHSKIALEYSI